MRNDCFFELTDKKLADLEDKSFWKSELFKFTKFYVFKNPSFNELALSMPRESVDAKIRLSFHLINHYFEFALPKYLKAFELLFNYAYSLNEDGLNLGVIIKKLEYGVAEEHEIIFKEIGFPHPMIQKISKLFQKCDSLEQIISAVNSRPIPTNLHPYELTLYRRLLTSK